MDFARHGCSCLPGPSWAAIELACQTPPSRGRGPAALAEHCRRRMRQRRREREQSVKVETGCSREHLQRMSYRGHSTHGGETRTRRLGFAFQRQQRLGSAVRPLWNKKLRDCFVYRDGLKSRSVMAAGLVLMIRLARLTRKQAQAGKRPARREEVWGVRLKQLQARRQRRRKRREATATHDSMR